MVVIFTSSSVSVIIFELKHYVYVFIFNQQSHIALSKTNMSTLENFFFATWPLGKSIREESFPKIKGRTEEKFLEGFNRIAVISLSVN